MYMQVIEAEQWKLKSYATSQGARRRKQYYWSQNVAARGQPLCASSVYTSGINRRGELNIAIEVAEKHWQSIVNIAYRRQRTVSGVVAGR